MRHETAVIVRGPPVLLTGRPGIGKTTVIRRAVESLGVENCVGFYTEEVREGGRRLGFDVVTLEGRRGVLARLGSLSPRVGRYSVDVPSFERYGVAALEEALMTPDGRLVIIDEVGKMELLSRRFQEALAALFAPTNPRAILGSIMAGRHPKVDVVRARSDLEVLEVTRTNRDGLPEELSRLFRVEPVEGREGG